MAEHIVPIGFSPCPNDTFMFHALVSGLIDVPGVTFAPRLEDIETLNVLALTDAVLPVTKLSFGVLGRVLHRYGVLAAGAALGHRCGPLVVARQPAMALTQLGGRKVASPGMNTSANLLFRMFAPSDVQVVAMRFDHIVHSVARGEVEAGVIIHESRFTYSAWGLELVADLGEMWEQHTKLPIPLGFIAARRDLDWALVHAIEHGLRKSVALARAQPEMSRAYVRSHAQELSDTVCDQHIALYVNEFSLDLAEQGRAAVEALLARARSMGMMSNESTSPWL